jgi:hypothetical protein
MRQHFIAAYGGREVLTSWPELKEEEGARVPQFLFRAHFQSPKELLLDSASLFP